MKERNFERMVKILNARCHKASEEVETARANYRASNSSEAALQLYFNAIEQFNLLVEMQEMCDAVKNDNEDYLISLLENDNSILF